MIISNYLVCSNDNPSLTLDFFTQVSESGPHGPLVVCVIPFHTIVKKKNCLGLQNARHKYCFSRVSGGVKFALCHCTERQETRS